MPIYIMTMLYTQGSHAGLTKSRSYICFPFVRPYKVLFLGIFGQKGLTSLMFNREGDLRIDNLGSLQEIKLFSITDLYFIKLII